METILIYFAKSSALIALFYLSYFFLIQKETFFNSNRWFLLFGLLSSALLPLCFIKKMVVIGTQSKVLKNLVSNAPTQNIAIENTLNWLEITTVFYKIVFIILLLKIGLEIFSLFKLIKGKPFETIKPFVFIDVKENINPFSFFKYIVYNSSKYSKEELSNIICHEKIHASQNHSLDILLARFFCLCFWFNPFIWLYKKAIIQNLEYIADKKAIQNISDKKAYQMTLLKVVTNYNYIPIANSFYQPLIKKRIIMLNKTNSKQQNIWKYAIILPALMVFVFLFQVKTIAQEKAVKNVLETPILKDFEIIIDKNSSDEKIRSACKLAKEQENIDLKISRVKRNAKNEIVSINIALDDNKGNKSNHNILSDEPIETLKIAKIKDEKNYEYFSIYSFNETSATTENTIILDNTSLERPIHPTPPTPPNAPNITPPTPPVAPQLTAKAPKNPNNEKAWKKYELAMESYDREMLVFDKEMLVFDKKMEDFDKVMETFDKKMEVFDKEMLVFDKKIEAYEKEIEIFNQKRASHIKEKK